MIDLSKEERIELVLLSGHEGWSFAKLEEFAEEFNIRHSYHPSGTWSGSLKKQACNYVILCIE